MSAMVKMSEKGQLVIPKDIRERINLHKGDTVNVTEFDGIITIRKTQTIFDIAESIKVSDEFDAEKALEIAKRMVADDKLHRN